MISYTKNDELNICLQQNLSRVNRMLCEIISQVSSREKSEESVIKEGKKISTQKRTPRKKKVQ